MKTNTKNTKKAGLQNRPERSGTNSERQINFKRRLEIRAGQLLKIEVLDHVIVGSGNRASLRELGYFY